MRKILTYIEANLFEDLNVKKLASEAAYSSFHFLRLFYELTHLTPMEYIRKRRLTESAIRVMNGKDKIIQLALACGYNSEGAFIRAFKQQFGITPGQMKRYGRKEFGGFLQPLINWGRPKKIEIGELPVELKSLQDLELAGFTARFEFDKGWISPYEIYEAHKQKLRETGQKNLPVHQYTLMWEEQSNGAAYYLQGFDSKELNNQDIFSDKRQVTGGEFAIFTIDPTRYNYLDVDQYIFQEWLPQSEYRQNRTETLQIVEGGGCPCHNTKPYRMCIQVVRREEQEM